MESTRAMITAPSRIATRAAKVVEVGQRAAGRRLRLLAEVIDGPGADPVGAGAHSVEPVAEPCGVHAVEANAERV